MTITATQTPIKRRHGFRFERSAPAILLGLAVAIYVLIAIITRQTP